MTTQIAIFSHREIPLRGFAAALQEGGARVTFCHDLENQSLSHCVIVDGVSSDFRSVIQALLKRKALVHTAVMTDLDEEAFHELGEGLGILTALPVHPGAQDAKSLLAKLWKVDPLLASLQEAQKRLETSRQNLHEHCVVCWDRHPFGLKARFQVTGQHSVEAEFPCGKFFEGYTNVLHGGIVSSLLDGAMANCILAKGIEAYTVDLRIRFRQAVNIGVPAIVKGEWLRAEGPLHLLEARLIQEGKVKASARAKFFEGTPGEAGILPATSGARDLVSKARKRL